MKPLNSDDGPVPPPRRVKVDESGGSRGVCRRCGAVANPDDLAEAARRTRVLVMEGRGERNAMARLAAANKILDEGQLEHLTDEQLAHEARRIAAEIDRRKARERAK